MAGPQHVQNRAFEPRDPPIPAPHTLPPTASLVLNLCPPVNSTIINPVAQAYTLEATSIFLPITILSPCAVKAYWSKSNLMCGLWNQIALVHILPLPLSNFVVLGKLPKLSGLQCSHLEMIRVLTSEGYQDDQMRQGRLSALHSAGCAQINVRYY